MTFTDYIKSEGIKLCAGAAVIISLSYYFYIMGYSVNTIAGMDLTLVFIFIISLIAEYVRQCRRLKKLNKIKNSLTDHYLIGELLKEPSGYPEICYYEVMKTVTSSAIEVIEKERREKEEYLNYIESWIHEIKTPLTACSLIISNDADPRKLKRELKRAENMTDSVLYYARMRSFSRDTVIEETDTETVINESVRDQMQLLIAAGISVKINGNIKVFTDKKALKFMIGQLLINCAKYCHGCSIYINSEDRRIVFEDNGPGIPSHELPRVTERGFTGRSKSGSSTGMGLYIVSEMCRNLDIDFKIDSEEGKYTKITFEFINLTKM